MVWLNTLTPWCSETAKREQPLCPWVDRAGAQVWPGAVSLERARDHPGKPAEGKDQSPGSGPSCGAAACQHPRRPNFPAWFCCGSTSRILSPILVPHRVTRGQVPPSPPAKLSSRLVLLLRGLLSPSGTITSAVAPSQVCPFPLLPLQFSVPCGVASVIFLYCKSA